MLLVICMLHKYTFEVNQLNVEVSKNPMIHITVGEELFTG
jgi:hypothetical protein